MCGLLFLLIIRFVYRKLVKWMLFFFILCMVGMMILCIMCVCICGVMIGVGEYVFMLLVFGL